MKKIGSFKLESVTCLRMLLLFCATALFVSLPAMSSASWDISTVDSPGSVGRFTSIALDSDNNPHISYYDDTNDDLKYAKWTGSSWKIQTIDSQGNVGSWTSIALDSDNNPHISYYDDTNDYLKYAKWTGSSWKIATIDSQGNVGKYTSIALDTNNTPHISYSKWYWDPSYPDYKSNLKYARWSGSSWEIQTVDSEDWVGTYTSIALDTNNRPHIAYRGNGVLKYAKWTGSSWEIQTINSEGGVYKYAFIGLALDANNYPHISYVGYTNDDLKYARWSGSTWEIQTVDSAAHVSVGNSIALDVSNNPHISYYENYWNPDYKSNLKYARWSGSSWEIQTVDSEGDVGQHTSIALDTNNNPHISYYDDTNDDLKYAKWMAPDATSINFSITSGWNLLSLPLVPDDSSVDVVLSGIKEDIESAWKWVENSWAVYLPSFTQEQVAAYIESKGFIKMTEISSSEGFWVNSDTAQTLTVSGTQPLDTSCSLISGWNLIGLKSNETKSISDLVFGNEANIASVWKWESGAWAVYLPGQDDGGAGYAGSKGFSVLSNIEQGEGFWVNCNQPATIP